MLPENEDKKLPQAKEDEAFIEGELTDDDLKNVTGGLTFKKTTCGKGGN